MLFGEEKAEKLRYQREWFEWAESENVAGMAMALEEGQKIDEIVLDGLTAGSICALGGRMRLFDFLRDNGFDFQTFDGHKRTPLMCSAEAGTLKIASKILSRGDPAKSVAFSNEDGMNALHFAAKHGNAELVHFLISKGANPDASDNEGNTPLHWSMVGGAPQAVAALLHAGASPSAENKAGKTPEKMPGGKAACRAALEKGGSGMFGGAPFSFPTAAASSSAASSYASSSHAGSAHGSAAAPDPASLSEALEEAISAQIANMEDSGGALFSAAATLAHERLFATAVEAIERGELAEAGEIFAKIVEDNVNPFVFADTSQASLFHALAKAAIESGESEEIESLEAPIKLMASAGIELSLASILDSRGESPYDLAIAADDAPLLSALFELSSSPLQHKELASLEAAASASGAEDCSEVLAGWRADGYAVADPSSSTDPYASGRWSDFLSEKVADAISQRSDYDLADLIATMASEEVDVSRATDPDGKTLLHYLAESGKIKFLEGLSISATPGSGALVLAGTIDTLLDAKGASPYDIALRRDNSKLLAALWEAEPECNRGAALIHTLGDKAAKFSSRHCQAFLEDRQGLQAAKPSMPRP